MKDSSSKIPNPRIPTSGDFEELGELARKGIAEERRAAAALPAIELALRALVYLSLAFLLYLLLAHSVGSAWPVPGVLASIAILLLPPCLLASYRVARAGNQPIELAEALAALDERHGFEDRLQTASEFLPRSQENPFMRAAVLDATEAIARARELGLPAREAESARPGQIRALAALACLLFVAALLIPRPFAPPVTKRDRLQLAGKGIESSPKDRTKTREELPPERPDAELKTPPKARQRSASAKKGKRDADLSMAEKKTEGVLGSGQSADAASASGASEARGAPSSQAQSSGKVKKPSKRKPKKKKKKKKAKPPEEATAKKPAEDSGSTAGRGAASGSNKSPSASPWSSKDQVTSEDEEDLEDDEEVDDETDSSDARGGVQPHLRDRRPPVNRDLGIGFGNQKNPDANGRGGPSEQKKSRGVAALVLGVPIPDHIKGKPNPGKTKITQERVKPRPEGGRGETAKSRGTRNEGMGYLHRQELMPWMRKLLKRYFERKSSKSGNKINKAAGSIQAGK